MAFSSPPAEVAALAARYAVDEGVLQQTIHSVISESVDQLRDNGALMPRFFG